MARDRSLELRPLTSELGALKRGKVRIGVAPTPGLGFGSRIVHARATRTPPGWLPRSRAPLGPPAAGPETSWRQGERGTRREPLVPPPSRATRAPVSLPRTLPPLQWARTRHLGTPLRPPCARTCIPATRRFRDTSDRSGRSAAPGGSRILSASTVFGAQQQAAKVHARGRMIAATASRVRRKEPSRLGSRAARVRFGSFMVRLRGGTRASRAEGDASLRDYAGTWKHPCGLAGALAGAGVLGALAPAMLSCRQATPTGS